MIKRLQVDFYRLILNALLLLALGVSSLSYATVNASDFVTLDRLLVDKPEQALATVDSILIRDFTESAPSNEGWHKLQAIRARALIKLGEFKVAKDQLQALLATSESMRDAEQLATYLYLLGFINNQQADFDASMQLFARAKNVLGEQNESHIMADILAEEARTFRYQTNYQEALIRIRRAQELFKKLNMLGRLADTYNGMGVIYNYLGDFDSALPAYEESLSIQRTLKNQQGISNALYNIGELYRDTDRFSMAFLYFKQSLDIDRTLGNPIHIANSLGKLAQVSLALGELKNARRYVDEGLKLTKAAESKSDTAWQLSILASILLAEGQAEEAFVTAQEALVLAQESKAKRTELLALMTLVDIEIARSYFDNALTYLNQLLDLASLGVQERMVLLGKRALVYRQLGDLVSSLDDMEANMALTNKFYQDVNEKQQERFRYNSEFARQANALELAEKNETLNAIQLQNIKLERSLLGLSLLLVVALGLILVWRGRQKQRLMAFKSQLVTDSLNQKKRLFADVSHELRTPLTASKLIVEALVHNIEPDTQSAYQRLDAKLNQLDTLISDIYQSAQFDAGVAHFNIQPVLLGELINEVVLDFKPIFAQKLFTLEFVNCKQPVRVQCDPVRMKQVLGNLLKNSLAYTDSPGKVLLTLAPGSTGWRLTVEDSAPGVSNVQLPLIFERMYRADESRSKDAGGSGLGLSISQQIIETFGWKIKAQHSDIGGLCIKITIPSVSGK